MVYRVVATKLSEEEHTKLLDRCTTLGCTPSSLIKEAIMDRLEPKKEIKKYVGVKRIEVGLD